MANAITCFRILFSIFMLFVRPLSPAFCVLYALAGVSDAADGFLARKTRTESDTGARLDSIADVVFLAVCLYRLIPVLNVPRWILIWTGIIAALRLYGMTVGFRRFRKLLLPHSRRNKLTGLLLFLLPLTARTAAFPCCAAVVCGVATYAAVRECAFQKAK